MNTLVNHGIVDVYPPLMDIKGSYSAQFEHVCLLLLYHDVTNDIRPSSCASQTRRLSVEVTTINLEIHYKDSMPSTHCSQGAVHHVLLDFASVLPTIATL
jgi:hypothetical protein